MCESNELSTALMRGTEYASYRARHETTRGTATDAGREDEVPSALPWLYIAAGRHMDRGLALLRCAHDDAAPIPADDPASPPKMLNSSTKSRPKHRGDAAYKLLERRRITNTVTRQPEECRTPAVSPIARDNNSDSLGLAHQPLVTDAMQPQDDAGSDYEHGASEASGEVPSAVVPMHPQHQEALRQREQARKEAIARDMHHITYGLVQRGGKATRSTRPAGGPATKPPRLSPLPTPSQLKDRHHQQQRANASSGSAPRKQQPSSTASPEQFSTFGKLASAASLPSRHDVAESTAAAHAHFAKDQLRRLTTETQRAFVKQSGGRKAAWTARGSADPDLEAQHRPAAETSLLSEMSVEVQVAAAAAAVTHTNLHAANELNRLSAAGCPGNVELLAFGHADVPRSPVPKGAAAEPRGNLLHPAIGDEATAQSRYVPRKLGHVDATSDVPATTWVIASVKPPAGAGYGDRLVVGIGCTDTAAPGIGEAATSPDHAWSGYYPIAVHAPPPVSPEEFSNRALAYLKLQIVSFFEELARARICGEEAFGKMVVRAQFRLPRVSSGDAIDCASPSPEYACATESGNAKQQRAVAAAPAACVREEVLARAQLYQAACADIVLRGSLLDLLSSTRRRKAEQTVVDFFAAGIELATAVTLRLRVWRSWHSFVSSRRAARLLQGCGTTHIRQRFEDWRDRARRSVATGVASIPVDVLTNRADCLSVGVARWARERAVRVEAPIVSALRHLIAMAEMNDGEGVDEVDIVGHGLGGAVAGALALRIVAETRSARVRSVTTFGAPPLLRETDPCMSAVLQTCDVSGTNVLSPSDPASAFWEGWDAAAAMPRSGAGLGVVTCERLPVAVPPPWSRAAWGCHTPSDAAAALLDAQGIASTLSHAADSDLLGFESIAWNPATGRFADFVVVAIDRLFRTLARSANGTPKDTIDPVILATTLSRAQPAVPPQLLVARALAVASTDAAQSGDRSPRAQSGTSAFTANALGLSDARAVPGKLTNAVFLRFLEQEFACYSPQTVLDLLDLVGYFVAKGALHCDPSLADPLLSHPPGSGPWPSAADKARVREPLCPIPGRGDATQRQRAIVDVFEHYARAVPTSPFVGSGLSARAATLDCMQTMLEAAGAGGFLSEPLAVVVRRAWMPIEGRHIAAAPFGRSRGPPKAAALLMTFEGGITLRGFEAFLAAIGARFGPAVISVILHALGFNERFQHAITRGALDNVHRPEAPTCLCDERSSAEGRLFSAEDAVFRAWVEEQLADAQQEKLRLVSVRSQALLARSNRRGTTAGSMSRLVASVASISSNDDDTTDAATTTDATAIMVVRPPRNLQPLAHRPAASTPGPSPARGAAGQTSTLSLSAAVRGKGPLAEHLRPKATTPGPQSAAEAEAAHKARREKRRRRTHAATFVPSTQTTQATGIYGANHGIKTLTPQQRAAMHV